MDVPFTLPAEPFPWPTLLFTHFSRYASNTGLYVSGTTIAIEMASAPASIAVSQLVQCQSTAGLVAMKSATVGATNGPRKTKTERTGKMYVRSRGDLQCLQSAQTMMEKKSSQGRRKEDVSTRDQPNIATSSPKCHSRRTPKEAHQGSTDDPCLDVGGRSTSQRKARHSKEAEDVDRISASPSY